MRRIHLNISILFVLLLSVYPARAQESTPGEALHRIDSLETLLKSTAGEEKLNVYHELAMAHRSAGDAAGEEKSLQLLIAEARRQDNLHDERSGMMKLLTFYYNNRLHDKFRDYVPVAMELFRKHGLWEEYFNVYDLKLDRLIYSGDLEEAQKEAQKMYEYAKEVDFREACGLAMHKLGKMYYREMRYEEAEDAYLEAEEIFTEFESTFYFPDLYEDLTHFYHGRGEYDRALGYNKKMERWIEDYEALYASYGKTANTAIARFYLQINYTKSYTALGQYDRAQECLKLAEANPAASLPAGKYAVWGEKSTLYFKLKDYDRSFAYMDSMYVRDSKVDAKASLHSLKIMADRAYSINRMDLAADSYRKLYEGADSLRTAENNERLNELRTVYEVDKLEAEKARQRTVIAFTGVGCLLLAAIVVIYIVYSRRLRRKNLSLYRRIQELTRSEKEARRALDMVPEVELSREMKLFRQLERMMAGERPFTDPSLDRGSLAARLGTNEKYLADAVREGAGTTIAAYISDLRLAWSLELLSGSGDITLDAIAEGSGHGSYSSFFRSFMKKYGMSPSDYRKLSAVKEVE